MIGSKLSARLERLEARMEPEREPIVLQIRWVSPDGSSGDGPRFIVPFSPNTKKWSARGNRR